MTVVHFYSMRKRITRWRRRRWVNQGIENGRRLRELRIARAGIDATIWPHDAEAFDSLIDSRSRRQERLIANLKNTEAL